MNRKYFVSLVTFCIRQTAGLNLFSKICSTIIPFVCTMFLCSISIMHFHNLSVYLPRWLSKLTSLHVQDKLFNYKAVLMCCRSQKIRNKVLLLVHILEDDRSKIYKNLKCKRIHFLPELQRIIWIIRYSKSWDQIGLVVFGIQSICNFKIIFEYPNSCHQILNSYWIFIQQDLYRKYRKKLYIASKTKNQNLLFSFFHKFDLGKGSKKKWYLSLWVLTSPPPKKW